MSTIYFSKNPDKVNIRIPMDVGTLRKAGYPIDYPDSTIVYLDPKSYQELEKKLTINNNFSLEKINNTYLTEEISNIIEEPNNAKRR